MISITLFWYLIRFILELLNSRSETRFWTCGKITNIIQGTNVTFKHQSGSKKKKTRVVTAPKFQIKPKAAHLCETENHLRWFLVGPAGCGAQHRKPVTYRLRTGEPDLWTWCTDLVCWHRHYDEDPSLDRKLSWWLDWWFAILTRLKAWFEHD